MNWTRLKKSLEARGTRTMNLIKSLSPRSRSLLRNSSTNTWVEGYWEWHDLQKADLLPLYPTNKKSFPHDSDDAIHPPGYNKYPSLLKIVAYLELNKLTTTSLAEDDIQAILDKLIYDGKIERKGTAQTGDDEDDTAVYKAIRDRHGNKTAWTEIPCGTCPVYDQCDDEGPITPESCEYIKKWLAF